ncbi:MAG: single-stranded-DNA-specific exonuclease RecJ [Alphaproteobacteria bacterium]
MSVAAKADSRLAEAVLGVERSVTGKRWRARLGDDRLALALAQRLDLPEIVARILAARGVGLEDAASFLDPRLRSLLPDPSHLLDMDKATDRIVRAVREGEKIAIFGDYDVDGATSAALLARYLAAVGSAPRTYIPDRVREGYGPNGAAMRTLAAEGIRLVITVDCGISAHQALQEAREAGLDVVVVDHHEAESLLPAAAAVINPNRLDEASPLKQLAAVGVAFLLAAAVNRRLRADGHFGAPDRPEPDLMGWLDLVALGTICDVVPLTGLNRALVAQGLKVMARRGNIGLAALADVAGLDARPGTYHAGFLLGPRVNAGGRVGRSDLGVRLLTTSDAAEARAIASELDGYNQERRRIEAEVLAAATAQAESQTESASPVFVAGEDWHPGVIGIVASRLKERFGRPAFVIALHGDTGKGSARSIGGVDVGAAVIAARRNDLLINGGGHAMAAGLTVARAKVGALRDFLARRLGVEMACADAGPSLGLDGTLSPEGASRDLVALLERIGPFGVGNAEPRFAFPMTRIAMADVAGQEHVRCVLMGPQGGRLKGIAFRALQSDLGRALLAARGGSLHLAGRLGLDDWQGREGVQLFIDDAAVVRPR